MSGRLVIVSNRLPITVSDGAGGLDIQRSPGGLATGLAGPHDAGNGLWIGWAGLATTPGDELHASLERELRPMRLIPVPLSADELQRYYEGFSNGVLWPLFHHLGEQVPLQVMDWEAYHTVNRRFADAVIAEYQPGDRIWVHDYQLMLVPAMLRERLPDARIGFFLHIPFPASEIFRTLPHRSDLLEGLLGADLVGFHTGAYLRNFGTALTQLLGSEPAIDRVEWKGRRVRLGAFPMGVDAARLAAVADSERIRQLVHELRGESPVRLLVGIDRLDYTKGIPRRLLAYEELLSRHPELHEHVRLIQVSVPSRTGVDAYQEFRQMVDGMVGRIQGRFGTPRWMPVHYIYRSLDEEDLLTLYRAADVLLVTPIRDGMNLVAKEFIASRTDGDGVLVLSEFAGAAAELAEALQVNPFDVEGTADAIARGLEMPEDERRARMAALRRRVTTHDIHHWVRRFLQRLDEAGGRIDSGPSDPPPKALLDQLAAAPAVALLLDYDGTLVPIAQTPELAKPDAELGALLRRLAARSGTELHIVSGRSRETLERWLGDLPVALHAEHGLWSRLPGEGWVAAEVGSVAWRRPVLAMLEDATDRTPGSLVEAKTVGYAWHYRAADAEFGEAQANELRVHLSQLLSNAPVEVLSGHKVIEVRPQGITKGRIAAMLRQTGRPESIMAIGDDATDEDLFAALPRGAVTIRVGSGTTRARYRLAGVPEVRALLESLDA